MASVKEQTHNIADIPELLRQSPLPGEILLLTDKAVIMTGRSNPALAQDVVQFLSVGPEALRLHEPVTIFPNGESNVQIAESVRGKSVYIINTGGANPDNLQDATAPQGTKNPLRPRSVDNAIMETLFMIQAAKIAGAEKIEVITPCLPYSRGDRKDEPRKAIPAKVVLDTFVATGATGITVVDIHADQEQGFVNIPVNLLFAGPLLLEEDLKGDRNTLLFSSADLGGAKRVAKLAELAGIGANYAFINKQKPEVGKAEATHIICNVPIEGQDVKVVEDMFDTGGTAVAAAEALKKEGAKTVMLYATHGIFSGDTIMERINNPAIDGIVVTDSVYIPEHIRNHPKVRIVSIAGMLAHAIARIHTGGSLTELIPKK